jgi:hypothetical protein
MTLIDPKQIENKLKELTKTNKQEALENLETVISKLPISLSALIDNAFKYKRIPKEYLLSSILFTFSSATGRTFFIDVLGYKNYTNLYFASY